MKSELVERNCEPVGRLRHAVDLMRGVWSAVAIAWGLVGGLTLIRDNLLTPEKRQPFETLALLPKVTLAWWLAIALLILLCGVFEGSFRVRREERSQARAGECRNTAQRERDGRSKGRRASTRCRCNQSGLIGLAHCHSQRRRPRNERDLRASRDHAVAKCLAGSSPLSV